MNDQFILKAVVDAARDPKHPFHSHFEWNDAIAAENYRLDVLKGDQQ